MTDHPMDDSVAWIETVPEDAASGSLRDAYAVYRDSIGYLSKFIQAFSLRPELIPRLVAFQSKAAFGSSSLGRRREELISVAVSALNGCAYCEASHSHHLKNAVDAEEAERIVEPICNWGRMVSALEASASGGLASIDLSDADRAMLVFANKLTLTPSVVDESDVESLRDAGFSDTEIMDIVVQSAWGNFVNRICLGLGVEPEERFRG